MVTAGQPFTRQDLVSLKRADIQKLCKDYGVRANMKTEALIELLLDSIQSNMSPLVGPRRPQPAPAPIPRRVSTRSSNRVSSLRSRGTSGSSSSTSFVASSVAVGSPHTSKSKLTQYKLGVGRPSVTSGSGLRASSRSSSTSKANRGKNNRLFKPPEATIVEEPETSQPIPITDQNAGPSSSRGQEWSNPSATDSNDVVTRLNKLESMFREADVKHQLDSLRNTPSQVAYLKASVQQREAEIQGLRGELNVCKSEVLTLRSEVSKIALLEDQLRAMKDSLDQLRAISSSSTTIAKGKATLTRRTPTPFSESNVNSNTDNKTTPLLDAPVTIESTQTRETAIQPPRPPSGSTTGPSDVALGKRPHESNSHNAAGGTAPREGNMERPEELARRIIPDRKRARTGAARRPLQEKPIEPKPEPEKPATDHEGGDDCVASAGSSASGPSTQPSVSTPPPAPHAPEHFPDFDVQHGDLRSEDIDLLDFCQAASSTPRNDIFNFFDEGESFSQLSATKLAARIAALDSNAPQNSGLQPVHQEPRRISTAVARPRTPPRPSGHARFRIAVDAVSPVREDVASPFDPYSDGVFGLPFGAGLNTHTDYARREVHNENQNQGPAPMPLALGFGLASATGGAVHDDSPVRPTARTMYGTELHDDNRFGDFGRDGIAGSSTMQYWSNF